MKSDICIVGGGPAGLAAALALTQRGREATVVDCAVPPIDKACGEGLMPDSIAALEGLGVTLPEVGASFRGIRFCDVESSVSADFPNGSGRGLRRVFLHQVMVERAERAGIRMLWGLKNVHTRKGRVSFNGGEIETKLIVGADGLKSSVRQEAGLSQFQREKLRYGFRKHYEIAPWSPYSEIYWGNHFQIYITPVAADQICVALISTDPHLRVDEALKQLSALNEKLRCSAEVTAEKGSLSVSRMLRQVCADGYVLVGDASGSVDAITGEGMCLAFKQAAALADAVDADDMRLYQRRHREIGANPLRMAALMLVLDGHRILQRRVLAALAANPKIFADLLAGHVGQKPLAQVVSRQFIPFGFGVLRA